MKTIFVYAYRTESGSGFEWREKFKDLLGYVVANNELNIVSDSVDDNARVAIFSMNVDENMDYEALENYIDDYLCSGKLEF